MSQQPPMPNADAPASPIPEDFTFTQSGLQAYEDCPRRFWLTYVRQLPWPALEAAPAHEFEQNLRWGARFHKLLERAESGMETDPTHLPPPLDAWWRAYRTHRPQDLDLGRRAVEFAVSTTIRVPAGSSQPETDAGLGERTVRLAAKFDLVSFVDDGPIIIIDWKTGGRRPRPESLQQRWQSLLYPFVLVEAATRLGLGKIEPGRVELRYWYTSEPAAPIVIRHSPARHAAIEARLRATIGTILAGRTESDFPKIPDTEQNRRRFCRFCVYRSRCDRGVEAGDWNERGDDAPDLEDIPLDPAAIDFSLDDVGELAF